MLLDCLASFDFESYRLHLNMQTVHLRGLNIGPVTRTGLRFELRLDISSTTQTCEDPPGKPNAAPEYVASGTPVSARP